MKPTLEQVRESPFAEWVMRAHKDGAHALNVLAGYIEMYAAEKTEVPLIQQQGRVNAPVDLATLLAHLRDVVPRALGRAAANQHADHQEHQFPACGCSVDRGK